MRWFALAALVSGSLAATVGLACQGETFFFCDGADDCGDGGACEPNGACSFPDPDCGSGRRFGAASVPPFAGECTDATDTTSSTVGGTESGLSTSSTGPTSPMGSTSGEETTGAPQSTGLSCPDGWWDCDWSYRRRVSVTAGTSGALSGVPVAVRLGPGRIEYELMQADAEDLRIVSAGGSVLPYEIENWDPVGASLVWTAVDLSGSSDDHFWIYYGNAVAESSPQLTDLWSDVYAAVWHMAEGTRDSSANGQHASAVGEISTTQGQMFEGSELLTRNSHLEVGASPAVDDLFFTGATISAWIRPWGWGHNGYGRILDKGSSSAWLFYLTTAGELVFSLSFVGESDSTRWRTVPDVIALATWSHVAVTFDVGAEDPVAHIYVNGVEQIQEDPPTVPVAELVSDVDLTLAIGNRADHNRQFEGILDEVRLEKTVRTPGWIRSQHESGRDTLLQFGEREEHE
ncbi:MAG: DUF2341 domain-containing protein [Nannocystaceae bacterium]|nr:DUF2341 domain-containing protein [Nannocystaceae bacterium]